METHTKAKNVQFLKFRIASLQMFKEEMREANRMHHVAVKYKINI